jgi:transposase
MEPTNEAPKGEEKRPLAEAAKALKSELTHSLELAKRLRDELKLEAHLGGMEARDRWKDLEPELERAMQTARDSAKASAATLKAVLEQVRDKAKKA